MAARAFGFELRTPEQRAIWRARIEHLRHTDPDGGFVAVREGQSDDP